MKKVSPHERTLRQLGGEGWKTGVRLLEQQLVLHIFQRLSSNYEFTPTVISRICP